MRGHAGFPEVVRILHRCISTSGGPLHFRQKVAYKTRYHWMLDLQKSRQRARFPWIPREPPTFVQIADQNVEFPEMMLEFVVPKDLDKCELKPYVDWRATTPVEEPLTAERLFEKKYLPKIQKMYERGMEKSEILEKLTMSTP
ncbi:39S ribosomal protein L41 mitochondrial [Paragonimus heterotremus]|uniref:39S ribosomal protein L41 mitochondrial n=1 Tax=Paragonimus heterotremus TaxID=100268 RepID=A0A8J4T6X8_9TREM|nr:39S ribosomal protein L41 mitochondrial [Paragonimus heterotremus]